MKFKGAIFVTLLALLALLLPFQFCPQACAQDDVEYWAVIVGVADYEHLGGLDYPDDDAQGLYNDLSYYWSGGHFKLLLDEEATKDDIDDAITDWLDPDSDDIVLFFFAGHGDCAGTDYYYLCPYDSLTDSWDNDISDAELDGWLDDLESEKIVVILDSCYSGGFASELPVVGRVIMTACAEDEEALEYPSLGHSVFSYYILDGFNHLDDVDTNNDNKVSAEEFFYYAEPKVRAYTVEEQIPQLSNGYPGELNLFAIPSSSNVWIGGVIGGAGLALVVTILVWRGTRRKVEPPV